MTKKKVRKLKTATKAQVSAPLTAGASVSSKTTSKIEPKVQEVSKLQAIKQYFREVRAEFDKITWANRKETTSLTIAVLAISFFFAAYLGLVDMLLSKLVGVLMG